jgi:hypothetical protein
LRAIDAFGDRPGAEAEDRLVQARVPPVMA